MGETRVDAGFEVWRGSLVLLVVSGEFFFAKARSRVRASLPAPNPEAGASFEDAPAFAFRGRLFVLVAVGALVC